MKKLLIIAFLIVSTVSFGQYHSKNKKAIKMYQEAEQLASFRVRKFDEASVLLTKALEKDPNFVEAMFKLASIKSMFGDDEAAFNLYKKGVEMAPDKKEFGGVYKVLAYMYHEKQDFDNALKYFQMAASFPSNNYLERVKIDQMIVNCNFAIEALKNPLDFKPVKMPKEVNYLTSQSYPCLTADNKTMIMTVYDAQQPTQANENIEITTFDGSKWSKPKSISHYINSVKNEGTGSISGDGRTLVFTACNRKGGLGSCDIYISTKEGKEWSTPKNLGPKVNSSNWESEPTVTADGATIYFSSRRGAKPGKENIWYTTKDSKGQWTQARALDTTINNELSQVSPFIHADGKTLYFASNGHPGMGGYDIYRSVKTAKGWSKPENLGYPLNTTENESTIFITADYSKGYFAKTEKLGMRRGDFKSYLYEFEVPQKLKKKRTIYAKGTITDKETKKPLKAEVVLYDLSNDEQSQKLYSDSISGEYLVVLTEGTDYALYVKKEGYLFESVNFDFREEKTFDPVALDVALRPIKKDEAIVLNNIFFTSGHYDLLKKSKTELNQLVKLLKFNSKIKVEISGHTDNVGSSSDNLTLSKNRAAEVVSFLTKNGIEASRLQSKGYGETKPVGDNGTEEGRAKNRRIEFKVISE